MSLALSTITRTLSLSITGTSIGPALAISMQENPPAAAVAAKPADIFKASRRLKLGMVSSPWLAADNRGPGQRRVNVNDRASVEADALIQAAVVVSIETGTDR